MPTSKPKFKFTPRKMWMVLRNLDGAFSDMCETRLGALDCLRCYGFISDGRPWARILPVEVREWKLKKTQKI